MTLGCRRLSRTLSDERFSGTTDKACQVVPKAQLLLQTLLAYLIEEGQNNQLQGPPGPSRGSTAASIDRTKQYTQGSAACQCPHGPTRIQAASFTMTKRIACSEGLSSMCLGNPLRDHTFSAQVYSLATVKGRFLFHSDVLPCRQSDKGSPDHAVQVRDGLTAQYRGGPPMSYRTSSSATLN